MKCIRFEINTWKTRNMPWTVAVEEGRGVNPDEAVKRVIEILRAVNSRFIENWASSGRRIGGSPLPPRYNGVRYCVEDTPRGRIETVDLNPGGVWETRITVENGRVAKVYSRLVPREARIAIANILDAIETYGIKYFVPRHFAALGAASQATRCRGQASGNSLLADS